MAKAGTIHVDIQATTTQLQAGLKNAEAQVAASTARMNRTSRTNLGGAGAMGALGGGAGFLTRAARGFGLGFLISRTDDVMASIAEKSLKIATAWERQATAADKARLVLDTVTDIPFVNSWSDSIIKIMASLGNDKAAAAALQDSFQEMFSQINATDELSRQKLKIAQASTPERKAQLEREFQEKQIRLEMDRQIEAMQRLAKSYNDLVDDVTLQIDPRPWVQALERARDNQVAALNATPIAAGDKMRPGKDEFGTSLGRVRFLQNTDFTPLHKPATESTAKATASATRQAAGTLTQILRKLVKIDNVGFA